MTHTIISLACSIIVTLFVVTFGAFTCYSAALRCRTPSNPPLAVIFIPVSGAEEVRTAGGVMYFLPYEINGQAQCVSATSKDEIDAFVRRLCEAGLVDLAQHSSIGRAL